jgi:predicted NBD/HSP70 family sugar kinase
MERLFNHTINLSQGVELKNVYHKKQILRILYFHGPLSNSEISGLLNLSIPKITSLLLKLIEDGLVRELGRGDSSGGRRPNIYGLAEDGFYVAGITININLTIISVFNSNNREVAGPYYCPVKMMSDFDIFPQVNQKLEELLQTSGIPREKILVVGIELPGLINQKQGINKTYFPDITNLSEKLQEVFGLPVVFSHNSKLRAFAEQHFGLARNRKNVLMIQVDWGLGLGIIINGRLYSGRSGYAGEFGHLPIVDNGILCSCGKQGCLETMVSATAITRIARQGIKEGRSSLINELVNGDEEKIDISIITDAANRGDQFAISIFSEAGYWLGKGIVYLIQIFNPELIVLGGRVTEASQFIMAPLQQAINTFSNRDISHDTEIQFSILGQRAGTLGAAAYALEKIASLKK